MPDFGAVLGSRSCRAEVEAGEAGEAGDAPAAAPAPAAAAAGGLGGMGGLMLAVNGGGTMTKLFLDDVKDKGATGADDDDAPLPSPLPAPDQRGGAPHRAGDNRQEAAGQGHGERRPRLSGEALFYVIHVRFLGSRMASDMLLALP